jgi:hypothetical protein
LFVESISPTNLHHVQEHQHKVNSAKDAVLFYQHFTAHFMPQLLHRAPYFGTTLPNAVAIKSSKKYMRINGSTLTPKMLVKLTPQQELSQLENNIFNFSFAKSTHSGKQRFR